MAEITQNFGDNANLWIILLTALVCGILLAFLVLLIFRRVSLWYWKVDLQIDTLKCIDEKLDSIETEIKEKITIDDDSDLSILAEGFNLAYDEKDFEEKKQLADDAKAEVACCISKSGRVYTETELEELIKN